jgi:hypothetical protein
MHHSSCLGGFIFAFYFFAYNGVLFMKYAPQYQGIAIQRFKIYHNFVMLHSSQA